MNSAQIEHINNDIMQKTDEELITEYQHGNQEALEELFARYKKPILNFAFRILSQGRKFNT